MRQVVFNSDYQDEVTTLDKGVEGLVFMRGIPNTVTDEQAAILLKHPSFSEYTMPNRYVPPPPFASIPPASEPEPAAN